MRYPRSSKLLLRKSCDLDPAPTFLVKEYLDVLLPPPHTTMQCLDPKWLSTNIAEDCNGYASPQEIRSGSGWNEELQANIKPSIHVKGHWEVDPDSAHSLPDGKWFVSKISIQFLQISFHRDSCTQSSLRHLLCHRSRLGLSPCPPRCYCGVWYCGSRNPSRAPLYFIRVLRFGVHMFGVLHHWQSTDHLCWQPPFTSIQGSLWRSSGFSVITLNTGLIGPVLYVLCTSDVAKLVEALDLGAHLYADDTQLYGHCSPSNSFELASRVPRAFDAIHEWMFSLNTGKTQFIWLGTKHSLAKRDTDRPSSILPSLTEITSVRNLGYVIDQELIMKHHIIKLCQSCYYQIRQIRTVRHSLTSSTIQTLVHGRQNRTTQEDGKQSFWLFCVWREISGSLQDWKIMLMSIPT